MKPSGFSSRTSGSSLTPVASMRLLRARMGGHDDRQAVVARATAFSTPTSLRKLRSDSMFSSRCALTTKSAPGSQAQARQHVRCLDAGAVVVQHLEHRAAGLDDPVRRQALAQQVLAGDVAVGQVDVGRVVDDAAVDLLRHAHVEAAIAGLHVEDRESCGAWPGSPPGSCWCRPAPAWRRAALRPARRSTAMITLPIVSARGGAGGIQEVIRLADAQVVEEDLVQLVVVVLAGVDEHVLAVLVQLRPAPATAG